MKIDEIMKEISRFRQWSLRQCEPDFFQFGTDEDFSQPWGLPVNQCGTAAELIETLEIWKDVDFENTEMLEMEDQFLQVLHSKNQ